MTDHDFLQAVGADPSLPGPKRVWADFCEERGDDAMAYALRWCARHGKWPWQGRDDPNGWYWEKDGDKAYHLPPAVFDAMRNTGVYICNRRTIEEGLRVLGHALLSLKELVDL